MKQSPLPPYFPYGFAVSEAAWRRFEVGTLPGARGTATKGETVHAAQRLAGALHGAMPEGRPARAGELLAMGLLTDALRAVAYHYCSEVQIGAFDHALAFAAERTAPRKVITGLLTHFPPAAAYSGDFEASAFLSERNAPIAGEARIALETVLLALANENLAMRPYTLLHDDAPLRATDAYVATLNAFDLFFAKLPPHPHTRLTLLETLRAPMRAAPDSLEAQLDYIRGHWSAILPEDLLELLVTARGILREESQFRGHGPGPTEALRFFPPGSEDYPEFEAFSHDKDWMPNVVLIAKQTYVWLDQLARRYQRPIHRLDQVPDEELDQLARWGFNGLWLIGLWERSPASRDIKRRMGNPEAEASAYSLYDYTIAHDIGGEAAYRDLAARAWRRGIRLASDMVPNHVGIYSRWVIEHPDWFIQSHEPPFPTYRFTGPDLSCDHTVGLYLEDGYWTHSDAAVVFKRVDHRTGDVRYLYHGNDGTNMPWNDTAQLDFRRPDVREAVIQTVLHVARMFPIIRFDAAMTLAKKHFQRLWFPRAGDEGAIPSRAAHGMTREAFDELMPKEFWREVVDRVAAEVPDTLLLAEAFWLMEGYFVRTLGMHRVYNSAFMNMLKMEDNAKYRATLRNVLEFSPEVLQRFVNFMNNPDEDTAEAQFGTGDKYFGVAVLMATMPGLPMFGHGQIEGLTEKYGMEYRRAYKDEQPNGHLIWRHEREIFPILHRRRIFSGARHFALYDFVAPEGHVDENVYAYSNRDGDARALVVFNNSYHPTRGVVHVSTAINEGSADAPQLRQRGIAEALGLNATDTGYYILRDHIAGLEYLHHSKELCHQGFSCELRGYQCRVFLEFQEVHDTDLSWAQIHTRLKGHGVPSMAEAYKEHHLRDVLDPFDAMLRPEILRGLLFGEDATPEERLRFSDALHAFHTAAFARLGLPAAAAAAAPTLLEGATARTDAETLAIHFQALLLPLGNPARPGAGQRAAAIARDWLLGKHIGQALVEYGIEAVVAGDAALLTVLSLEGGELLASLENDVWGPVLHRALENDEARRFLRVHHYGGKRWLNREQLERLIAVYRASDPANETGQVILDAAADCGYDFDAALAALK